MIVASIRTPTPKPTPSSLKSRNSRVANTANTPTMTRAAQLTVPAVPQSLVCSNPCKSVDRPAVEDNYCPLR